METADSASHDIKLLETNHQFWTQMLDSWTPFSGLCQILLHGVVLLKDCGSPGYSDSGLQSCLLSSLQILCRSSGETSWLSSQTSGTPGALKPLLVLLEDETSISMKVLSRRKPEGLQHLLVESALSFDLMKHGGSKPSLAENLQLELQQLGLRASPTLPPDSWTSISCLSSAQVRLPTLYLVDRWLALGPRFWSSWSRTPAAGTPGESPSFRSLSRSCFPAASTTFSTTSVPFISPWRFTEMQPLWSDL